MTFLHWNRVRHDVVIPTFCVSIAAHYFHYQRVRNVKHQMGGGPKCDWSDSVVRCYRQEIGVGKTANLASLSNTATPGKVRHDDICRGLLNPCAHVVAGKYALALANGNFRGLLEPHVSVHIVRRHDFLQPENVIRFERTRDTCRGWQIPARVAFDSDRHAISHRATDVFNY